MDIDIRTSRAEIDRFSRQVAMRIRTSSTRPLHKGHELACENPLRNTARPDQSLVMACWTLARTFDRIGLVRVKSLPRFGPAHVSPTFLSTPALTLHIPTRNNAGYILHPTEICPFTQGLPI